MRPTLLFLLLLILLPVSAALQDLLPGLPPCQERILLTPIVFCFAMMALPLVPALFFALATALVQGLILLQIQGGQAELGLTPPVVFFLTWAIVLQMASEATRGMRWEIHALGSSMVTLTLVGGEFLLLCLKRGGLPLSMPVLLKIIFPAVSSLMLAPLLYFILRKLVPVSGDTESPAQKPVFTR
jgi:hypothetical protein